jgi:hypothetical protein
VEWGALLKANGYQLKEECLPLIVMARYLQSDGKEASREEIQKFQEKARKNLAKFTGRTRKIDKREFLHFQDYYIWPGRKVKNDLKSEGEKGLVTASWNQWVQGQGPKVNDITVKPLQYPVDEQDYYVCNSGTEEALHRRNEILEDARRWRYKEENKLGLIKNWKTVFEIHLADLYIYRQAITTIRQNYFDGLPILFQDLAGDMEGIITNTEELATKFNELYVDLFHLSDRLDLEAIRQDAGQQRKYRLSYIIDMAKAEALDSLGEREEGVKLVERYL